MHENQSLQTQQRVAALSIDNPHRDLQEIAKIVRGETAESKEKCRLANERMNLAQAEAAFVS